MIMQTTNRRKEGMLECVEYLELKVEGVRTYAYAFVMQSTPYWLLLGRPWQKGVKLEKIEREDGNMEVEILDPKEDRKQIVVPMRKRRDERLKSSMLAVEEKSESEREEFKFDEKPSRSSYGKETKIFFASISRDEKMAIDEGGDIQCDKDVILEEKKEEEGNIEEVECWVDRVVSSGI